MRTFDSARHCLLGLVPLLFAGAVGAQAVTATRIADINSASDTTGNDNNPLLVRFRQPTTTLFFAATDDAGTELWMSVGHPAYGHRVRDIWPGSTGSSIQNITGANSGAFFLADDPDHGTSVWYSDGTAEGTRIVGAPVGVSSPLSGCRSVGVQTVTVDGSRAFLALGFGGHIEYWKVDEGALDAAVQLAVLTASSSAAEVRTAVSGGLYFARSEQTLVRSNGTAAGTSLLVSDGGPITFADHPITALNGQRAVFWRNGDLWLATASGVQLLLHAAAAMSGAIASDGGFCYFASGGETWRSNGTVAGTQLFVDLNPSGPSAPRMLFAANGRLYVVANRGSGTELLSYDGSQVTGLGSTGTSVEAEILADGRALLTTSMGLVEIDLVTGTATTIAQAEAVGPTLMDEVLDSPYGTTFLSRRSGLPKIIRLCSVDGTPRRVRPIREMVGGQAGDSRVTSFYRRPNDILFGASTAAESNAVLCSLTGFGVSTLGSFTSVPRQFVDASGGIVVFAASTSASGSELWKVPVLGSPTQLTEIRPGASSSSPTELVGIGSEIYFAADDGLEGREIHGLNSQLQPSRRTTIGPAGVRGSDPRELTPIGSALYFSADDGTHGRELWRLATPGGATTLFDLRPGSSGSRPRELTAVGTTLFCVADLGAGWTLVRVDPAGTFAALTAPTADLGDAPQNLAAFGTRLLFARGDAAHGREPWISDGTPAGTAPLADLFPGTESSDPQRPVIVGGKAWFAARDPVAGYELFRTDGTAVGTALHADINPSGSSFPQDLRAYRGTVVMAADDGVHGREVWQVDSLTGTTRLLAAVAPDPALPDSSYPHAFFDAGDALLFVARNGLGATATGSEPYSIGDPARIPATVQSFGVACPVESSVPALTASGLPIAGSTSFGFHVQGPASGACLLLVGFEVPPYPLLGCTAYFGDPIYQAVGSIGSTGVNFAVAVPVTENFFGAQVVVQGGILGPLGGVGATNPLRVRVGG